MTADTLSWRKAAGVSCAIHLFVGLGCGAAVQHWPQPEPKEIAIAVELTAEESAAAAGGPLSAAPAPPSGAATDERAAAPRVSRPTAAPEERTAPAAAAAGPAQSAARDGGDDAAALAAGGAAGSGASPDGGYGGGFGGGSGSGAAAGSGGAGHGGSGGGSGRAAAVDGFAASVEAHKKYPYTALKRNLEGRPVVYVELDARGELAALSLAASSGVESLDRAALEAVRGACPYRHGLGVVLAMEVPVQYRLSGG